MNEELVQQEDVRKLHAEINQIMNQRFITTTTAVAFFGLAISALSRNVQLIVAPPSGPDPSAGKLNYILTIVLNLVLGALFLLDAVLKKYARVLTTYLDVRDLSRWEKDWVLYRDKHAHIGYTIPQFYILISMMGVVAFHRLFLHCIWGTSLQPGWGLGSTAIEFTVFLLGVYLLQAPLFASTEKDLRANWRNVLKRNQD